MSGGLDEAVRSAGLRIVAALAARFRDLDVAEEAFAEACVRAAALTGEPPRDWAAWLYRVSYRAAVDAARHRAMAARHHETLGAAADENMSEDFSFIPDRRLALIFACCHPALAPTTRAALTLTSVCGLSGAEVAGAFLLPAPTMAQRLVRAKRKLAGAGIGFEVPGPRHWYERLEAVLATVEIAYAKAHEDASGKGEHAGFAPQMLELTALLADMVPDDADVHALAATIRFSEARRPARIDAHGHMVPLSEQDPARWDRGLIADAQRYVSLAEQAGRASARVLRARLQGFWCARKSLREPPPWSAVLSGYDALLNFDDNPLVRLNRAVALCEVAGPEAALAEIAALPADRLADYASFHAVRAGLLRKSGRTGEARASYARAIALQQAPAERAWLERRAAELQPRSLP